jgi:sphingomyelin phosphodiesterase acid-like 3
MLNIPPLAKRCCLIRTGLAAWPRRLTLAFLSMLCIAPGLHAQTKTPSTIPVVMLSDIHFDPFHDPAKFAQLREKPVSQWPAVLNEPDSSTQAADVTALQDACPVRGIDTPWTLLQSSLKEAHRQQPKPLFLTVSGDLTAHAFDCRVHHLAPTISAKEYTEFSAKVASFVALELRRTFPRVPVYLALGNNDSSCSDYHETQGSEYLQITARSFAEGMVDTRNRNALLREFSDEGDYSVVLPRPMQHARLIVLQNIFESKKYESCAEKSDDAAADAQVKWLHAQLTAARAAHEHVWVMAHIPPGVDAYATFSKSRDVCAGQKPEMFLNSGKLADTLTGFGDIVRLAIFAHTHMDEMRLLQSTPASAGNAVPVKLVPSISPVNGNNPAFTVAQVDPDSAILRDYAVYAADNKTGIATTWKEEYQYSSTYGLPDFSAGSLTTLTSEFVADKEGSSAHSTAYQNFFFVGGPEAGSSLKAAAMRHLWAGYACSIADDDQAGFRACVCPATP